MKRLHLAALALVVVACSAEPIPPPSPSQRTARASLATSASPLPVAELVGRIRTRASTEPCQTLLVDENGARWEVWLPDGYRTAFQGNDELIYGPDGALIAASGQILGVDLDETAVLGTFCMAGRPVQASKVVFVTDATASDAPPFTAWPCTPAVAAPAYEDAPGIAPPLAYLGRPDGTYVPTLQGSYEWSEGNESADALAVLQGYVDHGISPEAVETSGLAVLALPEPYRMDKWHISLRPWMPETWEPGAGATNESAQTTVRVEAGGDPTPAVCFEAAGGDQFITAFFHSPDGRGQSTVYGRLTVQP